MITFNDQHIRKAEIAQLILLHHIYSQSGSHLLVFQGGTALRWCYGGSRFSEDLDFVFSCSLATVDAILAKALKHAEREMFPHFGAGALLISDKSSRTGARKLMVVWQPENERQRIAIKLEFEPLAAKVVVETQPLILSALPAVSYLIRVGEFRIPRANSVLVAESATEILSDKVRALLERKYLKGRDFFDVWFLVAMLTTKTDRTQVERKFKACQWPFVAARGINFFIVPTEVEHKEIAEAIETDLGRFLPPEMLVVHRAEGYVAFFDAVRTLFIELRTAGVSLP